MMNKFRKALQLVEDAAFLAGWKAAKAHARARQVSGEEEVDHPEEEALSRWRKEQDALNDVFWGSL